MVKLLSFDSPTDFMEYAGDKWFEASHSVKSTCFFVEWGCNRRGVFIVHVLSLSPLKRCTEFHPTRDVSSSMILSLLYCICRTLATVWRLCPAALRVTWWSRATRRPTRGKLSVRFFLLLLYILYTYKEHYWTVTNNFKIRLRIVLNVIKLYIRY